MKEIGVLGAGSWDTALAVHLGGSGFRVKLWAKRPELVREMSDIRENKAYLPGTELAPSIDVSSDLEDLADLDLVLVAVPSHGFREAVRKFLRLAAHPVTLISATKGIESDSLSRMSEVTAHEADSCGRQVPFAVLSGPTFAAELATGVPSAAVVAAESEALATRLIRLISTPRFRLYSSHDVAGVEFGGATKNVIAIGAGVVTGLGFGHNTLAALITRGLHEAVRLGVACGGNAETYYGLAGLGDLVLTCTGGLSRNRKTGLELAAGRSLADIEAETAMVAEGVRNSRSISSLASSKGIEMPITEQMMAILYEGKSPREAVEELMTRELKPEAKL